MHDGSGGEAASQVSLPVPRLSALNLPLASQMNQQVLVSGVHCDTSPGPTRGSCATLSNAPGSAGGSESQQQPWDKGHRGPSLCLCVETPQPSPQLALGTWGWGCFPDLAENQHFGYKQLKKYSFKAANPHRKWTQVCPVLSHHLQEE